MPNQTDEFKKVSVKAPDKREIAIIAATEGRYEYEIVADAMKLYKARARMAKGPGTPTNNVPVAETIAAH